MTILKTTWIENCIEYTKIVLRATLAFDEYFLYLSHAYIDNVHPSNCNRTRTPVIAYKSLYSFPQAGLFESVYVLFYLTTVTGHFLSARLAYETC